MVVHVLAPRTAGDEAAMACAALLREPGFDQRVVLVGDAEEEARAWAIGVRTTARVTPLLGRAENAGDRLRRVLDRLFAQTTRAPVLQCWCLETLDAVGRTTDLRERRVGMLLRALDGGHKRSGERLRAIAGDATLACFDEDLSREFAAVAGPADRSFSDRNRVLDTPDLGLASSVPSRAEVRDRLNLDDNDRVVAFLADPPSRGDSLRFMFTLGLSHAAARTTIGLAPRGTSHHRRSARFVRLNSRRWGLIESDLPLSHLLSAADAAVADAGPQDSPALPSCGALALRAAAELGVPTVGPRECRLQEHLGPVGAELTARSRESGATLPALLKLVEDSEYRDSVARAIKSHAARARSGHTLMNLWKEVANAPALAEEGLLPEAFQGAPA